MSQKIVVLNYGSGNVHSAAKALAASGAEVELSNDRKAILEADGLVVPGVGAFQAVMSALRAVNAPELIGRRLSGGRPVLGICVGMQVMFEHGVEGATISEGLGEWPGTVNKLEAPILPHIGWNTVQAAEGSVLFEGIEQERFYFVHSYANREWELSAGPAFQQPLVSYANYDSEFVAAVENGPLSATQFHPEKSGPAGLRLISNWVKRL
ncbi:MAG: imidazole glycerol phosphate synthase subunit HisH [Microbacteriaceae bacterium]